MPITGYTNELIRDCCSSKLLPALVQGVIIGAILVVVEVSFASIIFGGPLIEFAPKAAGMCIFGAGALSLVTGVFSPFSTMVSLPQDTPVAILSVAAISIAATMPATCPEALFATVSATVMASALVTGFFFCLIGKFRLSNFARFLPFPVIGGFLAGSGVMLLLGSFGVMTDVNLTLESLPRFLTPAMVIHWVPGVAFGFIVFMLMQWKPHFLILPGALLAGLILFFLVIMSLGLSVDQVRSQGWLLGALPEGRLWPAFTPGTAGMIDWGVLLRQCPDILTVALLSLVGMILNVNGIELGARQDIDLDRELGVEAAGNILAGLGGGFAGYGTLSLSMLGPRSRIYSRIIPVAAGLVCFGVLFLGAQALTYIPKPLLGGLLFLLGLFFAEEWIVSGWRRFGFADYMILLVIVLTIVNQGFLAGVLLGLGLTIVIFMVRLTQIPVIRDEKTLATLRSTRQRSVPDQTILLRDGHRALILKLAGYLFFGSSYFVGRRLRELFDSPDRPEHIILDLTKIQGFDISAVNTFQRMAQQALARDISLALAAAPGKLEELLKWNASPEVREALSLYETQDHALEALEDRLLSEHKALLASHSPDALEARERLFDAVLNDLDSHLERQERFESIMGSISPYLVRKELLTGDILATAGNAYETIIFVLSGNLSFFGTDATMREKRLASLGPGNVIAPRSGWQAWQPSVTIRAGQQVEVGLLPLSSLADMESDTPETAMALYKYMVEMVDENKTFILAK